MITGYAAVVDPAALGWTTEAFVELFCEGATSPDEIYASIRHHPEVVAAYTVTGDANALVHLRAHDIQGLEQALEQLRKRTEHRPDEDLDRPVPPAGPTHRRPPTEPRAVA